MDNPRDPLRAMRILVRGTQALTHRTPDPRVVRCQNSNGSGTAGTGSAGQDGNSGDTQTRIPAMVIREVPSMTEPIQAPPRRKTVRKLSNRRHIWGWPGIDSRPSPYAPPNASMQHADLLIETECCNLAQVRSKNDGAMAQLVAHLHGMQKVRSSNLLSSTNRRQSAMAGMWYTPVWGYGAAGSASPWHGEGQEFESP